MADTRAMIRRDWLLVDTDIRQHKDVLSDWLRGRQPCLSRRADAKQHKVVGLQNGKDVNMVMRHVRNMTDYNAAAKANCTLPNGIARGFNQEPAEVQALS
jgi:hypothetical protein